MFTPMRTMPLWLASSVDVISTDRWHRRQRSTSTEATGRESMLCLTDDADDMSESDPE
jgi:hypothetical protein